MKFLMLSREVVSSSFSRLFSQKSRFWGSWFSLLRTCWGWSVFIHIFICWYVLQFYWLWCFSLGSFSHILRISRSILICVASCLQALVAKAAGAAVAPGWARDLCRALPLQGALARRSVNTGLYPFDFQQRIGPVSDSSKLLEQDFKNPMSFIGPLCVRRNDNRT